MKIKRQHDTMIQKQRQRTFRQQDTMIQKQRQRTLRQQDTLIQKERQRTLRLFDSCTYLLPNLLQDSLFVVVQLLVMRLWKPKTL